MRPPKINDRKLLQFIDKEKKSQTEAAQALGVSRQAVSKRIKELRGKTTKVVVAKKIEQVVDSKIDTMTQLSKINTYANEILDLLMRWQRGDKEALRILESQVKEVKVGKGEDAEFVKEYRIKDPRELALKACSEVRAQLNLQLEIFQALFDMKASQDFQQEVLTAISEASPEVRDAIISNLNKKRAIRSAIKFS